MDFPVSTEPVLTVLPRGLAHNGGMLADNRIDKVTPARWTSKYGSIVVSALGVGTADGMNEKGLAMHIPYFVPADFGERDPKLKGLLAALWGQNALANAASVEEAIALFEDIQPLMAEFQGIKATLHLALDDAKGDSAINEYTTGGTKTVYHNRDYHIMTNDPSYDQQLAYRATFNFENATRETPIPGNTDGKDRFIRSDYYRQWLPEPKNTREAITGILAIARNASVPFGAPNRAPGSPYNTEHRVALDLTNLRYYFEMTNTPRLLWMDLSKFNLNKGAPVLLLSPDDINLVGDVTKHFKPGKMHV